MYDIVGILIDKIELRSFVQTIEFYLEVEVRVDLELYLLEDVFSIEEVDQNANDSWKYDQTLYLSL